jgi:hypothetical protein
LANTSNATDSAFNFPVDLKPDCSVYAKSKEPKDRGKEVPGLDFSRVEFVIEFKSELDPFADDYSNTEPNTVEPDIAHNPFIGRSGPTRKNLGQIVAYATAVLGVQYRTHMFMVLIVKDNARLIRWDRSGALVTAKIPFNEEPDLFDFFTCYNVASPEARGHDSTVYTASTYDAINAKKTVPELAKAKSLLAVEHSGNRYIIGFPTPQIHIPVGRWTRPSIAFDVENGRRVLLKDSWRVLLGDIEPEGVIYERLVSKNVPNIPSLVSAGDVGPDEYHQSRTAKALGNSISDQPCWGNALTTHRHYRIVLGVVGTPLEEFKRSHQLVNGMFAALKGEMTILVATIRVT